MSDKLIRATLALCDAATSFQDAVNMLWWAQNPEEKESQDGIYPDEEHAREAHSEAFTHLKNCIYEARKRASALQRESKA